MTILQYFAKLYFTMTNTDLQQIDKLLQKRLKDFATKDDLKNFATKDDLKKELAQYATKEDLRKSLAMLRKQIKEDIDEAAMDVFKSADKRKAEKENLEKLEKRVDKIEEHLQISPI